MDLTPSAMTLLAILFLIMAVGCRSIAELQQHGKLRWISKDPLKFWGQNSWLKKYKVPREKAPTTYYYKLFNLKYKERFPLSATFLVFVTDGMHAAQFAYHVFLALSLSMFSGYSFFIFWIGIVGLHASFYRIFSR